jgi:outer membrane autotransporter protein
MRYPVTKRLTIYGVYGFGGEFFYDKKIAFNESLQAKSSRVAKYGAGVEYSVNKNWALNGEASYHYSDTRKSTIDTWGWVYSLGLKYKF